MGRTRSRLRSATALVAPLLAVAAVVVPAGAGAAGATGPAGAGAGGVAAVAACATSWGSLDRTSAATRTATVRDVRAGRHECFDRFVVELSGPVDGWSVRYVDRIVQDGSGDPIDVAGGARLQVVVVAPAYDGRGRPTYRPDDRLHLVDVGGFRTFRQLVMTGSFEGVTGFGIGVRARLPFRVLTVAGPGSHSRLVVDVAHTW